MTSAAKSAISSLLTMVAFVIVALISVRLALWLSSVVFAGLVGFLAGVGTEKLKAERDTPSAKETGL